MMKNPQGRPRLYENNAEKMRAYRQRNKLETFTVQIKKDAYDGLVEYLKFKDLSKSEVIEKLIRTQLLRRR